MVDGFLSEAASLGSPGVDEIRWLKPVRAGDTLTVKNSAGIAHNINYSSDALNFNVTVPGNLLRALRGETVGTRVAVEV